MNESEQQQVDLPTLPQRFGPPSSRRPSTTTRSVSVTSPEDDNLSPTLVDTDPSETLLGPPQALLRPDLILQGFQEEVVDPNRIAPSPPSSRIATPTSLTPSAAISNTAFNPFRRSLRRLRTLTTGTLFPSRNPAPEVYQILPAQAASAATNREASSPLSSHLLPELSFDSTPLSILIQEESESVDPEETPQPSPQLAPHIPLEAAPAPNFPLVKYDFVDPSELTASPAETLISRFSITATPLPPSTPSWLSRNVKELELLARQIQPHLQVEPSSPDPLPIALRNACVTQVR